VAYGLALRGAREAGVDTEASESQLRINRQADVKAAEVHQPGEFVDGLNHGPRGAE
jgi:hypothetical protein